MATPMPAEPPSWAAVHLETFFDLDRWQVSRKGNPFIRVDGYCCTLFPARGGGWKWCVATDAAHRPLWSPQILGSERLARADAWEWLVELVRAEGEG
jgi:hypothetical protein